MFVVETENIIMLTECDASLAKLHSISTKGHQFMLRLCHLASTTGFVCSGIFSSIAGNDMHLKDLPPNF